MEKKWEKCEKIGEKMEKWDLGNVLLWNHLKVQQVLDSLGQGPGGCPQKL